MEAGSQGGQEDGQGGCNLKEPGVNDQARENKEAMLMLCLWENQHDLVLSSLVITEVNLWET